MLRLVPIACMPSPIPRQVKWNLFARTIPSASAFPRLGAGRLLHCRFRGLLSVHSRYGLHARQVAIATLCTRGFSSLVASTAALIATGWSEPVPGRVYPRCGPPPFHGAPEYATLRQVKLLRPPRLRTTDFWPGIAVERNIERRRESSALNGVGGLHVSPPEKGIRHCRRC